MENIYQRRRLSIYYTPRKQIIPICVSAGIKWEHWSRGYSLFSFDLTPDSDDEDHYPLIRHGNLSGDEFWHNVASHNQCHRICRIWQRRWNKQRRNFLTPWRLNGICTLTVWMHMYLYYFSFTASTCTSYFKRIGSLESQQNIFLSHVDIFPFFLKCLSSRLLFDFWCHHVLSF